MTTGDDLLAAAGHSVDPGRWLEILDELMTRIGGRFGRVEPRRRARAFVLGLLAELPRKNCWTIAEHAGDPSPDGMQHLLARAKWDADGVRDDLRSYVVEHLGDPGGVLVVDETGDVKKGGATPGVQRQYTGTAGPIENAQVAVYLGYAAPRGHALIDRELYLPKSWTDDPDRCQAAGIPGAVTFATKPRRWTSWYRWVTLAMLAAAFLTIAAATEHARAPDPADVIPLTRNEIAHLLAATIIRPAHDISHRMRWSRWRRHHQHRSRACHYQQQRPKIREPNDLRLEY